MSYTTLVQSHNPLLYAKSDGLKFDDESGNDADYLAGASSIEFDRTAFNKTSLQYSTRSITTPSNVTTPRFTVTPSSDDVTITMWVWGDPAVVSGDQMPCSIGGSRVAVNSSAGTGIFGITTWNTDVTGVPFANVFTKSWNHVAFTFNTSDVRGTLRMWINGVEYLSGFQLSGTALSKSILGTAQSYSLLSGIATGSVWNYHTHEFYVMDIAFWDSIVPDQDIVDQGTYDIATEYDVLTEEMMNDGAKHIFKFFNDDPNNKTYDLASGHNTLDLVPGHVIRNNQLPFTDDVNDRAYDPVAESGYAVYSVETGDETRQNQAFEVWVMFDDVPDNYTTLLMFDQYEGGGIAEGLLYSPDAKVALWNQGQVGNNGTPGAYYHTIEYGKLYHIVGVRNSTGRHIWFNGILMSTESGAADSPYAALTLVINRNYNAPLSSGGAGFTVYEAAYYDTDLSESQIRSHYATGMGSDVFPVVDNAIHNIIMADSPLVYYPCNLENQGVNTPLIDMAGTLNANITSGATFTNGGLNGTQCYRHPAVNATWRTITTVGLDQISCEAWVKRDSENGGSQYEVIFGFGGINFGGGNNRYDLDIDTINKRTYVYNPVETNRHDAWDELRVGEWYHIVINVDKSNEKLEIWINGGLVTYATVPTGNLTDQTLVMGAETLNNTNKSDCSFQHIAAYGHLLSESDIKARYEARIPPPSTGIGGYEDHVIADSPMSYWTLEESSGGIVVDKMGRRHGEIVNGTANSMYGVGLLQNMNPTQTALNFNGTDQYISIADPMMFGLRKTFSMEAIVEVDADGVSRGIFGFIEDSGHYIKKNTSNLIQIIGWYDDVGYINTNNITYHGVLNNTIMHVAYTFDGRYIKIYLQGRLALERDLGAYDSVLYDQINDFVIGANWNGTGTGEFWNGKIAHVAIFDHVLPQQRFIERSQFLMNGNDIGDYYDLMMLSTPSFYLPMNELDDTGWSMDHGTEIQPCWKSHYNRTLAYDQPELMIGGGPCIKFTNITNGAGNECYLYTNDLQTLLTNTHTISMWVRCDHTSSRSFWDHGADGETSATNIISRLYRSGEILHIFWESGSGTNHSVGALHTTPIEDDKVYHIVLQFDMDNGEIWTYVNGVKGNVLPFANAPYDGSSGRMRLGYEASTPTDSYEGGMSHFSIHDSIVDDTTIQGWYNQGIGYFPLHTDEYADEIILDTPTAYYRFGKNSNSNIIKDEMELIDGVPSSITFNPSGALNYIDGSISFNGVDSYVQLDDHILTTVAADSDSWTIGHWVRFTTGTDVSNVVRGSADGTWNIALKTTITGVTMTLYTVSQQENGTERPYAFSLGDWFYVVAVRNGVDNTIIVYVNGVEIYSGAESTTGLRTTDPRWIIGAEPDLSAYYASEMDELEFWGNAQSAIDIKSRYIRGTYEAGSYERLIYESGPLARFTMGDDGSFVDDYGVYSYIPLNVVPGNASGIHDDSNGATQFDGLVTDKGRFTGVTPFRSRTEYSAEMWIEFHSYNYGYIISEGNGGNNIFSIDITSDGNIQTNYYDGSSWATIITTDEVVPLGARTHIAMTRNNAIGRIYINGRISIEGNFGANGANGIDVASSEFSIGSQAGSSQSFWTLDSTLDQVILYDRECTAQEIKDRYESGMALATYDRMIHTMNPLMHFDMDSQDAVMQDNISGLILTHHYEGSDYEDAKEGRGISFAGTNPSSVSGKANYSSARANMPVNMNTLNQFSVSCWIKVDSTTGSRLNAIVSVGNINTIEFYIHAEYVPGTNDVKLVAFRNSGTDFTITSSPYQPVNEWIHVVLTAELIATNVTYRLYSNNIEVGSAIVTDDAGIDANSEFVFGSLYYDSTNASHYSFRGELDEFLWFNRTLTPAEIDDLYLTTGMKYRVTGNVTQDGDPVERIVRVYDRATGILMDEVVSVGGSFDLHSNKIDDANSYYIVALDDDIDPKLDPVSRDYITPATIP